MKLTEDQLKKLEDFYTDNLSPEDREAFLEEIKGSKDLQDFVEIYKNIDAFQDENDWPLITGEHDEVSSRLKDKDQQDLSAFSDNLKAIRKNQKTPQNKSRLIIMLTSAAAAAVIAFMFVFGGNSMSDIYAEHSSWTEIPSFKVKGATDQLKIEVEEAFEAKDYVLSEKLALEAINSSAELEPNLILYLGLSQLEQGKYTESIESFDKLLNSNAIDNHKGFWYKALTYLKMEDETNAVKMLKHVTSDSSNYKYSEALEILEELE